MTDFIDRFWTSADGLNLYARDYAGAAGAAKLPVICIHGLTRNSKDFEEVAPGIAAQGRRVLAVDVRGRGRSDRDPNPLNYQPPVYAGDMLALLAQAGIERAVFVGTSMGGLITMAVSAMNPVAVRAVVLNDVGPQLSPVGLRRIAGYVAGDKPAARTWDEAAEFIGAVNGEAFPRYGREDWVRFARRVYRETPEGMVLDYDPAIAEAFKAYDSDKPQPDLWPLFETMATRRPTLLVRGAISDLIDAGLSDRMREAAPEMAYAEVPHVGHAPMLTEPEAQVAIERFLAEVP